METLERVLDFLERLFPASLAFPDDRLGLQVRAGDRVEKVGVALELTPELLAWAVAEQVDLLYLHHPPIWTPISSLSKEDPQVNMLLTLYYRGISVLAHHTNLDSAPHGLAEQWVAMLALEGRCTPILPCRVTKFKLVTFVPPSHLDEVAQAIFSTGAGTIGNYTGCSFFTSGTGTFLPGEGARPFLGRVGTPERVDEIRLEVEVNADLLQATVEKLHSAHPYEEPVVDVYPLSNPSPGRAGLGRMVELAVPLEREELQKRVEAVFSEACLLATTAQNDPYRRVALCPGSGKSLVDRVIREKADVFITGELSHHEVQRLRLWGIDYLPVSHQKGEQKAMREICAFMRRQAQHQGLAVTFLEENA